MFRAPQGPLGNRRISAAPQVRGGARQRRRGRYAASSWLTRHSQLRRVRECGNLIRTWCEVKVAATEVAHYAGLRSCGSPSSCPVCAAKIAAARVQEVSGALALALDDGWRACFLTQTFSHHRGHALAELLDAQQRAWRLFTKSRTWARLRAAHGFEYVRVREHTWWRTNGWHPHFHTALLYRGDVDHVQVEAELSAEWRRCLVAVGLSGSVAHALRLEEWDPKAAGADLAGYLTKQLAMEVAGGTFKVGRERHLTPWELLDGAMDGEAELASRWFEHEAATHGRRTMMWSKGMRRYRPLVERTDQELAEAEVGGEVVVAFDGAVKRVIWQLSARGIDLLEFAEVSPAWAVEYVRQHAPPGGRFVVPGKDSLPGKSAQGGG